MLKYQYFAFFKHFKWHLVDARSDDVRVVAVGMKHHPHERSCVAEIEFVRGKNVDVPIELLKES